MTPKLDPFRVAPALMRVMEVLSLHFRREGSTLVRRVYLNGLPGFITLEADGELQTTALDIADGRISPVYVVRNPEKLRHLH